MNNRTAHILGMVSIDVCQPHNESQTFTNIYCRLLWFEFHSYMARHCSPTKACKTVVTNWSRHQSLYYILPNTANFECGVSRNISINTFGWNVWNEVCRSSLNACKIDARTYSERWNSEENRSSSINYQVINRFRRREVHNARTNESRQRQAQHSCQICQWEKNEKKRE